MSLTSRVFAPTASHELARVVAALLAPSGHAASRLIARQPVSTLDRLVRGPTGLGTSAFRPFERATDDRSAPRLYCPGPVRDDEALGEEVNDRLVAWARQVGIYAGQLDHLRAANFGRLMMLTYPETDDPDRLLAAGKCVLAEWAADDHYCDDDDAGADPRLLAPRLAIAMTALDPAHLPTRYAPELEQAMREDPVLVGLRSALEHMPQYATPAQMARWCYDSAELFVAFDAEAGWRNAGRVPPVWEYLAVREINSFMPCIALIDPVSGYELPASEYSQPEVRRAVKAANLAGTLINDLYSMAREDRGEGLDFTLPTLIAAEENCSMREAIERSVAIHNELMHTFESSAATLSVIGSPALQRFLTGVWAWLGGNREWHRTSARYHSPANA